MNAMRLVETHISAIMVYGEPIFEKKGLVVGVYVASARFVV